MSQIPIRNYDTDNYQTLSSYTNTFSQTERAIVQSLVESSLDVSSNVVGNIYTSPANDSSWNYVDLSSNYINTSAIFNYPAGTVTENSVIYVDSSNNDSSFNSYTTNISSLSCANNTYTFSNDSTSTPYYDCNYVVTQSILPNCNDDSSSVLYTFDASNANLKIQYAMQSRWNTTTGPYTDGLNTVGPDPLAITQDVLFNTLEAFGQKGTGVDPSGSDYTGYWASVDPSNGSIEWNLIDVSNQLITGPSLLYVKDRDMSGITLNLDNDVGVFRLQKADPEIQTTISNGSGIIVTDLQNIPLFDGNGTIPLVPNSLKTNLLIPGEMNITQFETLVNADVFDTVRNDWTFSIDISSNGGGYSFTDLSHVGVSDLDNSNLLDNPYYMQNYVSNQHHLDINSGNIIISESTNGFIDTANSINIDLSNGEILDSTYAGVDGQIILFTNGANTRSTDASNIIVTGANPFVYYSIDVPSNAIDLEEQTNPYFRVEWQKVAQQTQYSPSEDYLVTNNNAILTLYADGIVDSSYNVSDFDLSFNNIVAGTDKLNLWRIEIANNIIINPESFYSDVSYNNLVQGISTLGKITNITEGLTYNNYRMKLTAKTIIDISLYSSVSSTPGWTISSTGSYVTSSSDSAFATAENLPNYVTPIIQFINDNNDLSFNYSYETIEDSTRPGGLVDYVQVSYAAANPTSDPRGNYTKSFIIPQSEITRTYTSGNTTTTPVADASYSFIGGTFNKTYWELVYVITDSSYNATFSPHFGPFNNITLGVNNILQTNRYYAVRNKLTGGFAPQSALNSVTTTTISELELKTVLETIQASPGNSLSISGLFKSTDLKPFTSIIEATYDNINWTQITTNPPLNTDTYYGLDNNDQLAVITGNVISNIEYTPFPSTTDSVTVVLDQSNYYIPFTLDLSNNAYTLSSFNYTPSQLSNNTNISATEWQQSNTFSNNTNYLTVQNNYSSTNVGSWLTSEYNSIITRNGMDVILTVNDLSNNTVFSITAQDTTVFLGTIIISYIPFDTYRADRLLGSNTSPTFQENFGFTNYTDINGQQFGLTGIPGVYIQGSSSYTTPSNRPVLGSLQSFRVIGDYASVNPVGLASVPTSSNELGIPSYNNGSLSFIYNSGPQYSATFTMPYYRGYITLLANQYYTIDRTSSSVFFKVDGSGSYTILSDQLTGNMYYNEPFIVNNLVDLSSNSCANLGITGNFTYSILPNGIDQSYPITVTGDNVTVTITNPNYNGGLTNIPVPTDATPVVNPISYTDTMTLKNFGRDDMYTFSGNWYLTNQLMAIRPSRVKLTNSAFNATTTSYQIKYVDPLIELYKAIQLSSDISYNWLGNPSQYGSQNNNVVPSNTNWVFIRTLSQSQILSGLSLGVKTIYLPSDTTLTGFIKYFVSVPPYYIYEQISTDNCPLIPYDYTSDYLSNQTTRFYPYTGLTSIFNPFAATVPFIDIFGNTTTVINNQSFLNNVTFTLQNPLPTLTTLFMESSPTRISAIVPGTNISIALYLGNYPSITPGDGHTNPIYNGPITSIPSTPDINNTSIIFRDRDASGGIHFSVLQYPADIGYSSGSEGYIHILHTTNQSEWYNIDFTMGNPSWYNDNSGVTFFNLNATGIFPTLYTVVDMNDPLTQTNYRRIYKYTSPAIIDIDLSESSLSDIQTLTIPLNTRQYCDIDISGGTFGTSGIWNYSTILRDTNIGNTPIVWTTDASFVGTTSYVGWSFGNSTTAKNMLIELLGVQDTQQKWTYITLEPFMSYRNQFGVTVSSVAWDGSITAPLVKTRVVNLYPSIQTPVLQNNTTTIEQYSESTLN